MKEQEWMQELAAEIRELEELLAKAELNNNVEGKWVVYLLKNILNRRMLILEQVRQTKATIH